ncbi:hypothetical protein [Clostridium saccharobutylicum]|uniref:Uncharacterized protein n=1 Tax=Clostridium saccharobutylicum TaxID=169679 RepID=A0A1S8N4F2_CLOSA|nr:hypothetical protein [Clostridium saccharobutylicum]OOM11399.1 hypothetical protein CLOSAC_29680 [Clostridium saccharobutylicum]OOM12050.1 hypothetical protein CLOSAC_24870 [Clostridium saccharobutylicum]
MEGEYCDKINLVVARVDENTKKLHNKLSNKLEKSLKKVLTEIQTDDKINESLGCDKIFEN